MHDSGNGAGGWPFPVRLFHPRHLLGFAGAPEDTEDAPDVSCFFGVLGVFGGYLVLMSAGQASALVFHFFSSRVFFASDAALAFVAADFRAGFFGSRPKSSSFLLEVPSLARRPSS